MCVWFVARLAENPEGDNDSQGQSEELLHTMESSTSTDSSLIEGKQSDLHSSDSDAIQTFEYLVRMLYI